MLEFQAGEIEKAGLAPGEEEALRVEKARQANAGRLAALSGEAYGAPLRRRGRRALPAGPGLPARGGPRRDRPLVPGLPRRAGRALSRRSRTSRSACATTRSSCEVSPGRLDEIESRLARHRAAQEEVRRDGGGGHRVRRALPPRARRSWPSPEEQERTLEARRERLGATYLGAARAPCRGGAGPRRSSCAKRVQAELGAAGDGEDALRGGLHARRTPRPPWTPREWTERGLERAEFLLSPNPGEELRPLARIASGGELSRIMLALKSVVRVRRPRASRSCSTRSTPASGAAWPRWWAGSSRPWPRGSRSCASRTCRRSRPSPTSTSPSARRRRRAAPSPLVEPPGRRRAGRGGRPHAGRRDDHLDRPSARPRDAQAGSAPIEAYLIGNTREKHASSSRPSAAR